MSDGGVGFVRQPAGQKSPGTSRGDTMNFRKLSTLAIFSLLSVTPAVAQQAAAPAGGTDHVAAIKQSLQQSAAALRQYEWIETTIVSIKGEEKSFTQKECLYGPDGEIHKIPIGAPPPEVEEPGGLKGKIIEMKKKDIAESMQEAIALVKQYVPPDPARIQAAKENGEIAVGSPDASGNVVVNIADYLKAGDSLSIDLNAATNMISGLTIASYTDSAKHEVGLDVAFGSLADGAVHPATIDLEVSEEHITVEIKNTDYTKAGG
jgi:hypothetical protein